MNTTGARNRAGRIEHGKPDRRRFASLSAAVDHVTAQLEAAQANGDTELAEIFRRQLAMLEQGIPESDDVPR